MDVSSGPVFLSKKRRISMDVSSGLISSPKKRDIEYELIMAILADVIDKLRKLNGLKQC